MLNKLQEKFAALAVSFYDWGSGLAGKLTEFLRLAHLSAWLHQRLSKRPAILGVELFAALSLVVTFYLLVRPTCLPYRDGNVICRQTFCYLSEHVNLATKDQVQLTWKKRLAGPMLSAWLLDMKFKGQAAFNDSGFEDVFGFYHAVWLLLLFLILILFRKDALFLIFAVFGGLMYNLTDPIRPSYYLPWDMPAMFFFTLACLLYDTRRMWLMMVVVCLGGLFKETCLCSGLLILLGEHWPWRKRVAGFAAAVVITFTLTELLMALYGVKAPMLSMNDANRVPDLIRNTRLFYNFNQLFSLDVRHVVFVNAGSLFIIILLPWRNRREVVFKLMIFVFVLAQFFCGIIREFRIWYELLPLGWMLIADTLLKDEPTIQEHRTQANGVNRVLKGSYWMTIGVLSVVAVGVLILAKQLPARQPEERHLTIQELIALAPKGDVTAQYNLGQAYENGFVVKKDLAAAADWYQKAAEHGLSDAQNSLGMLLATTRKDYAGAEQWFSQAAAQGNPDAQYNLGVLHRSGLGGQRDYELAARWFQKSAQQGHVNAQATLGKMYFLGQGVNLDYIEAYKWLKLAQLQGDKDAEDELKTCSASMTPDQIATAEKLAQAIQIPGK